MSATYEEYEEWMDSLQTTEDKHFHKSLLKYANHIIDDLAKYQQKYVADRLTLPTPTLSTYKPLLRAFASLQV